MIPELLQQVEDVANLQADLATGSRITK